MVTTNYSKKVVKLAIDNLTENEKKKNRIQLWIRNTK